MEVPIYAKIFASLWDGSLCGTGVTWAVFVFLCAKADAEGFVDIHPRVIASLTGFSEDDVRKALANLEAPDPESRTPDHDGSRIERIDEHRDWGWRVVNYERYRTMVDKDVRRAQYRKSQRRRRQNHNVNMSQQPSTSVNTCQHRSTQEEGEGEVGRGEVSPLQPPSPSTDVDEGSVSDKQVRQEWRDAFDVHFWPLYPRKVAKAAAKASWLKLCRGENSTDHLEHLLGSILDGLAWYQQNEWHDREPDKIPHPSTWLNQHRWEDLP